MRNIDRGEWAAQYPDTALVKLGGRSFYVLHNLKELDLDPAAAGFDVVVSGHSHRPKIETVGGRALFQSRKRRATPFQLTHCTRDA